jgi:hypothetical protein
MAYESSTFREALSAFEFGMRVALNKPREDALGNFPGNHDDFCSCY